METKGEEPMYLIREVFQGQRGKVPELVEAMKILDKVFEQAGYRNRRILVDYDGPMDTVVYECDVDSLDEFFTMERGVYADPDADQQALVDTFNTNAKLGHREIYEVLQ
jgi:hypothetical protein